MSRFILSTFVLVFSAIVSGSAQTPHADIHKFIDNWHLAAARADATSFFGVMADDAIYIGTADFERWTKPEFIKFAEPYFKKGKAWDFKPYDRDLHVSAAGDYAWFSELLTTWMGVCRGSGILVRSGNSWKISQYHLSVTVPNEIIDDFIKLVDGFNKRETK